MKKQKQNKSTDNAPKEWLMECVGTTISQPRFWLIKWKEHAESKNMSLSELVAIAMNELIAKETGAKLSGSRRKRGGQPGERKTEAPKKKAAPKKPAASSQSNRFNNRGKARPKS